MHGESILGQDLMACADGCRHIFELAPHQQRVFGQMKDAIVVLDKYDHLIAALFQEPAAPTLPAHRLTPHGLVRTRQPVRRRQGEQQPREDDVHPDCPFVFLRWMPQLPRLLGLLDPTVLDETALIIILKGLQRLLPRGIGQEDGVPPPAHIRDRSPGGRPRC
jgi:hypothetical protein